MRHAVQRHGQRHAGVEQVGQLLGEGGQFLELGLALLGQRRAHARWQKGAPVRLARACPFGGGGDRAAFGRVHGDGE